MPEGQSSGGSSDDSGVVDDLVAAIAEAAGVDPENLSPPVGRQVDVGALASFLESAPPEAFARFRYEDWVVEVGADGTVAVEPAEE